jgi:hypothetical protein
VASGRVRGARYQKRKNGVAASQSWALGLADTEDRCLPEANSRRTAMEHSAKELLTAAPCRA